jgi:hypothetical protein
MVVLKTPSQRNSFIKRMTAKYQESHLEHCGCCGHDTNVKRTGNRIILEKVLSLHDDVTTSIKILAVLKGRAR